MSWTWIGFPRATSAIGRALPWTLSLALTAAMLPPAIASQETDQDEEKPGREAEAEPDRPVIQDEVFVQGSAPDIPTSNTVAAKLPLSLRETPASVSVVESRLIEEQDAVHLGDALKNASGLNVQPGSGTFDFYVVRGIDSLTSGLILTDGAPEPETTAYPLYNIERVEVLKGPSSFLYGGGPMASTVNLVRKQPLATDFVHFGASAGSFATYQADLDANLNRGKGSFRLNSLWQQSENFRDDKDSENLAINPAFTWRPSERTAIHLNLEHAELDYVSDSGLPILFTGALPDVPRSRSYQSPFDLSDQQVDRFQLDVESRLSDRVTLRNKTYYRRLDWFSRTTTFNGVFPGAAGSLEVSRTLLELDDLQEFAGNQLELLGRFATGAVTHNLLFGVELARRDDRFTFDVGLLPNIDLATPVETAQAPFFLPGFGTAANARSEVVAPYVVDQISFSDRVQLLLGARYDQIDFEDEVTRTSRDDEQLSPMAGIVLLPTSELSFYASYGEGFAPPSTFVVGQDRVPEESQQREVGVKHEAMGGRLRTTLAVYRLDRENVAIPDSATGILQQTGDQRAEGVELEIAAEIASGLRALFSYAYTDSELTEFRELVQTGFNTFLIVDHSGNTPPFTPEHLMSFWVSKTLPRGWGIGAGGRYLSEHFTAEDNVFELDDYLLLDAAIFYTRGPWRLHLNLRNLTDEEYFTRAARGNSVIPRPGLAAYGGFRYTF